MSEAENRLLNLVTNDSNLHAVEDVIRKNPRLLNVLDNFSDRQNNTIFHLMAQHSCVNIFRYLLKQAPGTFHHQYLSSQNTAGQLPFHMACESGSEEMIDFLIDCRHDFNINFKDAYGNGECGLVKMARNGMTSSCQKMIDLGLAHVQLNEAIVAAKAGKHSKTASVLERHWRTLNPQQRVVAAPRGGNNLQPLVDAGCNNCVVM